MEISYFGLSAFKIKGKNATLVTDPFDSSMVGIKFPKVEADIVTISHDHDDHNRADLVLGNPFVVRGAGEYEIKGVTVIGTETFHDSELGRERGKNTVYQITIDGITIVHLGDLGHKLEKGKEEEIGTPDILIIPVGGVFTLDCHQAVEVISELNPKIVIPMHYRTASMSEAVFGKLSSLENFLKEIGKPETVLQQKYSISLDRLPENLEVVAFES